MPLYVEDAEIEFRFCEPVAKALKGIKSEMAQKGVTPSFALSLMKKYFQPLIPECHQDVLGELRKVSWDNLHWAYAKMAFRSGQPSGLLTDIAVSMDLICTFTKDPPRDFPNPNPIEVTHFLHMCRLKKMDIEHLRYLDDGEFDVFNACKYCWRQPVPGQSICVIHTATPKNKTAISMKHETADIRIASRLYKEGIRQKELFDQRLNQMLSREVWDFHESSFTAPILLPMQNIWEWMQARRPAVSGLLLTENMPTDDEHIIDNLLSILHNPDGLTVVQKQPYIKANFLISSNPLLIWPMLLRTEAWFVARQEIRDKWGGKRTP